MKIAKLSKAQCWGSRMNAKTKEFMRLELQSPEDVNQLMVNDTVFVKGDEIADDIGHALLKRVNELNADLVERPTKRDSITRYWLAPAIV